MAGAFAWLLSERVTMTTPYAIAIHGGAGVLPRNAMSAEREAQTQEALERVLNAGERVLADNGSALDAVTAAVCALEDEPLFNAGRGAVFTREGRHEMDAAVMEGLERQAGAIAGICGPKNPVLLARAVLEQSPHVLLTGDGALALAREVGLAFEPKSYFYTEERWQSLQQTLALEASGALDNDPSRRHGTVGAVARDRSGTLAAATSTGGMTAKNKGRVGDSPVIGAGTYAENASCAISATGDGEVFLRLCVAHEIAARVRLAGVSLEDAAKDVVLSDLKALGGSGGLIAVGANGEITMPFNCEGMYRSSATESGSRQTLIY